MSSSMAVSIPSSCFPSPFDDSPLFPDDSSSIGLYTTFGEDEYSYSTTTSSFGSPPWPDPAPGAGYPCSELEVSSSSFPSTPACESFTSMLMDSPPPPNPPHSLPCEDDLNLQLPPEFLQHFVQPECVDDMMGSLYANHQLFEEGGDRTREGGELGTGGRRERLSDDHGLNGELESGQGVGMGADGGEFPESNVEEEASDGVHIPPPLNKKRIEMFDDAYYDNIEAADVPLDVIENKRPFQCGLAGCDKTFKNPQTMKMHHKTHFSDGSAVEDDLPTLKPPYNGQGTGPNSNGTGSGWIGGRSKKIPSRCPKCRKTFVGLYELRRHYGRKHSEGERPFQCRKCDKRFYIEVDVRDHEKLCGEQIECICGLKFAFKCNMVAHKKAHPACHEASTNSTSVSIMMDPSLTLMDPHSTSVTIMNPSSDEDSSRSRWISSPRDSQRRAAGTKRCHELVEESRPDLMSKLTSVYSKRSLPAQSFFDLSIQDDAEAAAAAAAGFDFAALGGGQGDELWESHPDLPWTMPGPVLSPTIPFGSFDLFPRRLGSLELLHIAGVTPGM